MRMAFYFGITLLSLLWAGAGAWAQQPSLVHRERPLGLFTERFSTLASDTTQRHGAYQLLYKGKVVERGRYAFNKRVGEWVFHNYKDALELIYNYSTGKVSAFDREEEYPAGDHPCLFLGSPIVPHVFVAKRISYPNQTEVSVADVEVLLLLQIDSKGELSGYRVENRSSDAFSRGVEQIASQMPGYWRWIPATHQGVPHPSEYVIRVIFESE